MHFGTPYQSTILSQQVLQNELLLRWTISAPARSTDLNCRCPLDLITAAPLRIRVVVFSDAAARDSQILYYQDITIWKRNITVATTALTS